MHNKPFKVDASKVTRVLPDFQYITLEDSVRAAADSVVAMGLAAFHAPLSAPACCWGLFGGLGARMSQLASVWCGPAACAAATSALAAVACATGGCLLAPVAATAAAAAAADAVCGKQPQPPQQQKGLKDETDEADIEEHAMLASALSGGLEGSHEVMVIVTTPVGSEAKLTRLPSSWTEAGCQQL